MDGNRKQGCFANDCKFLIHPLLGYGYGSFWGGASTEFDSVLRQIHWIPMYAHNGYLEVMIDLGLIGLVLVCWFLVRGGIHAVRQADFRETVQDLFPLTLLVYYLIRNMTECTLLYLTSFEWALLAGTLLAVMPAYVISLRAGLGLGWMFVVAAEFLGASTGLGFLLIDGQQLGKPAQIVAAIVAFAILGKLSDWLLVLVSAPFLRWEDVVARQ